MIAIRQDMGLILCLISGSCVNIDVLIRGVGWGRDYMEKIFILKTLPTVLPQGFGFQPTEIWRKSLNETHKISVQSMSI